MFKKCLVVFAILMASSTLASAQDIFWSFSPTELISSKTFNSFYTSTGSVYIFSDGQFGFDAIDLEFTSNESDVIRFTGGEAFNPIFNTIGGGKFDSTEITIDAAGSSGSLLSVNITQNGVNPQIVELFDPDFVAEVGPNGAGLLARLDFELLVDGFGVFVSTDLEFALGSLGAIRLPDNDLDPSFGSATLTVVSPLTPPCDLQPYSLGDVNLSANVWGDLVDVCDSVTSSDIAPFIAVLVSGGYQREADCNQDGFVNFLDISPFIEILSDSMF